MQRFYRIVAVMLVGVITATGCVTTKGGQTESSGSDGKCVAAAAGGAIAGAILGALLSRNKVAGGAAGGVIGGLIGGALCLAVTSEANQTKAAAEVEKDYRADNGGKLPSQPMVQSYTTSISPASGTVPRGDKLTIQSQAQVVRGANTGIESVQELIQLKLGEDVLQNITKPMPNSGSGAFATTHTIQIPPRMQDGTYTVASSLLINGQNTGELRTNNFRVVTMPDGIRYAFLETQPAF
jgi:hypothetical protein